MKYLFIFLPFFCFGQGGDSTLYGVRNDPMFVTGERFNFSGFKANTHEFYVSDRKPKVVESFKYLGAYYELRENGWYKEILPDTIPDYGDIRIKGDSVFRWAEEPEWIPCNQQFGKVDHSKRDKIEQSEVKILVWTGCALAEWKVTKILHYDEITVAKDVGNLLVYIPETIKVNIVVEYKAGDKWIKQSHVIKEL